MTALALALLLAAPARAQGPLGADPLRPAEEDFAAGRYAELVGALADGGVRRLPRRARARAYDLLGQSHERLGQVENALRVYQFAVGLYPKDINILSSLANLLHGSGLDERAQSYFARVLAIHPHNAVANRGLAEIRRAQGMLAESAAHYERALAELPQDPALWRGYAQALGGLKDYPKAAEALQKALALSRDPPTLLELARNQRRRGLRVEAHATLSQVLEAWVEPALFDLQGLWRLEDGEPAEAAQSAARALQLDALDPLARWIRASAALRRGDRAAARIDLEAAAAQDQHPFIARAAAATLEGLGRPGSGR